MFLLSAREERRNKRILQTVIKPENVASFQSQRIARTAVHFCLLTVLGFLSACSPQFYHTSADREAFTNLFNKTPEVENVEDESVDITPPEKLDLSSHKSKGCGSAFLGKMRGLERGAKEISLASAMDLGIHHGRAYLTEKESVFISSLNLTLAQYRLAPIFDASGRGLRRSDARSAALNNVVATNTFSRTQSAGFNMLYKTGARITTDFTQDFLRFMTGSRSINDSALAATLIQPLLQGGGSKVTLEALTQADRNLLYDLRDFANFRRNFITGVVSDYYNILQARDQVQNNWVAYQGFLKNIEREEALAEEDRRTLTQLGQLRQATLSSESRWVNSVRTYQARLDNFKITLGIPVSSKIVLDDKELAKLEIEPPKLTQDQAVKIGMVTRPDLASAKDRIDDSARRVEVAKNGLLPGLDIAVQYNAVSDPGDTTPALNFDRRNISSSLDLDLGLDRKAERNNYRTSLIFLERAKRAEELARDRVKLEIFDDWRAIAQADRNYEIANQGVEVATRRLEEQRLLAELGKGEARDLVDAQNDLVNTQNQRTATLINHTLARLRLWRDMGILYISADGSWVRKLESE